MNRQTSFPKLLRIPRLASMALVAGAGLLTVWGAGGGSPLQAQTVESPAAEAVTPVVPAPLQAPVVPPAPVEVAPLPQTPRAGSSPAIAPASPVNESFIDSTDYNIGATQRSRSVTNPALSGLNPRALSGAPTAVQVGPLNISSYGIGMGSTPSVRDFYRRSLRPPGRLGNGNIQLVFPLAIPAPITSVFGWRIHPLFGTPRFHSGTDLGAPLGTPVLAAYAGRVVLADFLGGYGLAVALEHNKGMQQSLYGHLSEVFVQAGEWVKQGAVIGRVGSTGNSTGAHLHFEFREQTPDGWVALDAGAQLEYALAQLVKVIEVSEKGIARAEGIQVSRQGTAGVSGEIEWQETEISN